MNDKKNIKWSAFNSITNLTIPQKDTILIFCDDGSWRVEDEHGKHLAWSLNGKLRFSVKKALFDRKRK